MRDGDPDGVVGGPALAFSMDWVDPFLDHVRDHRLPLDFFSFHAIGVPLQDPPSRQVALDRLRTIRAALAARPGFETTEIHLNEYHPYKNTAEGLEKPTDAVELAVEMLEDFVAFLDEDDLTLVHWAQLMDSGFGGETFGLLDEKGRVRPAFYAFAAYNDLPVRRLALEVNEPFAGIAGGDEAKGGVLLWNRSDGPRTIVLEGLPRTSQEFRIGDDAPHEARPEAPGMLSAADREAGAWSGTLGPKEIVYLRWNDGTNAAPASAALVRTHHRASRGHGTFDRRSATAHVASGLVGATLEALGDRIGLQVEAAPGSLGLRIDYAVGEGYAKSLLLRDGGEAPVPPWGTGCRPTETIDRPLRGRWTLSLRDHAPEGWRGRATFSFASERAPSSRWRTRREAEPDGIPLHRALVAGLPRVHGGRFRVEPVALLHPLERRDAAPLGGLRELRRPSASRPPLLDLDGGDPEVRGGLRAPGGRRRRRAGPAPERGGARRGGLPDDPVPAQHRARGRVVGGVRVAPQPPDRARQRASGQARIVGPAWLADTKWAFWSLVLMALWGVGGSMVIYLAGLKDIPVHLYEAATLDGAGPWERMRRVTLPMLSPVVFFNLVMGTIAAFQTFTQAFVMTNGGPEDSTTFYALYLFNRAWRYGDMGYASAMAWILFVLVVAVTWALFRTQGRWVNYDK